MSPGRLLFTAAYLLVWPALMLLLAGDWAWPEGWIFGGWFVAVGASTVLWLYRKDPGLLAERHRLPGTGGQSRWTPRLPLAVELAGDALLALSWLLLFRSFADNSFGSALVRVQTERGHRVISTGVYGWVRHPMYLGATLMFVGGSLVTGAASALAAGLALSVLLAVRSLDEEALLSRELAGYDEYRRRVRYRLVPGIW